MALLALVTSVIAVVLSAAVAVLALSLKAAGASESEDSEGGSYYALEGSLTGHSNGSAVTAEELAASVTAVIEDDGGDVDTLTCPATPRPAQGVVTPCHGTIDGDRWAVLVIFDDGAGHYTVLQT